MQAIILVGGKGTRLGECWADRPKALVPLAGRPFLAWQLDALDPAVITSVHLSAGHLADQLQAWIEEQTFNHRPITMSREPTPMGTGGGLKWCESEIHSDPFCVLNGDSLLPQLDFKAFREVHRQKQGAATLAATHMQQPGRYGTVEFDEDGRVQAFLEKAHRDAGWVNGGVYIMSQSVFSFIKPDTCLSIEHDLFPTLARKSRLYAFETPPPLLDMGTPDGLKATELHLKGKPE